MTFLQLVSGMLLTFFCLIGIVYFIILALDYINGGSNVRFDIMSADELNALFDELEDDDDDVEIKKRETRIANHDVDITGETYTVQEVDKLSDSDMVKHPSHYQGIYGLEAVEVMKNFLPKYKDGYLAGMIKDVIKYILRAPSKFNTLEDLLKAREYLDFAIDYLKEREDID